MTPGTEPLVLAVDDDPGVLASLRRILHRRGYRLRVADRPSDALKILESERPDLILLDVLLPEMTGYELCARLQEREELAYVPVVFVTVLGEEEDRARAFAAGGADLVQKPFEVRELVDKVRRHVRTQERWQELGEEEREGPDWLSPSSWPRFQEYLLESLNPPPGAAERVRACSPESLYDLAPVLEVGERALAQYVADFLQESFVSGVDPDAVAPGLLPTPFCRANLVVPVRSEGGATQVILANPFRWELLEEIRRILWRKGEPRVMVAEPEAIRGFFTYGEGGDEESVTEAASRVGSRPAEVGDPSVMDADQDPREGRGHEVMALANEILRRAVSDRASDVHVEPKEDGALVRFRVDGDLSTVRRISLEKSTRLIARFKALGELDVAEKRRPQDGALEAVVHGRSFKLRLATSATPQGESLVVRLIEPSSDPPTLEDLGMSEGQAELLRDFAGRSHGLILMVGPTGSGKSTTIFSLLSGVDGRRRSIMSVEDPVEYRIPFANQQQVNTRAGVTFESLLKSAVRQDPDILLLGEIRDLFSAKASLDFASSGHLTVTTLHSSNATTAVFRLERLGVERGAMADAVLGVVAQKLLKKLCTQCRRVRPVEDDERRMLAPFTDEVPGEVAVPVGCPACRNTGYRGREGVFEILRFDSSIASLVRKGAPIAEIRRFARERGDYLISRHAVEKVRDLAVSPRDAYEQVLVEDLEADEGPAAAARTPVSEVEGAEKAPAPPGPGTDRPRPGEAGSACRVLVVEDDVDTRMLLERFLSNDGHRVVLAEDGVDALLQLGRDPFDVVLSDINMPNLDGLKLLEVMSQKGLEVPVVFLTAQTGQDYEVKGLELGAADFLTKPIKKDVLRLRLARILSSSRSREEAVNV